MNCDGLHVSKTTEQECASVARIREVEVASTKSCMCHSHFLAGIALRSCDVQCVNLHALKARVRSVPVYTNKIAVPPRCRPPPPCINPLW